MKTIHDFFVFDVVIEFTESEFEFLRAHGKLIQTVKLTGEKYQAGDLEINKGSRRERRTRHLDTPDPLVSVLERFAVVPC